jgi:ubiquinone/menaquinone biosynthesis C-methylase UbiE
MDRKAHWERVYTTKAPTDVSWYQTYPTRSMELIQSVAPGADASIIDVGGGDSVLVDALLGAGHRSITILDISGAALRRAQARLGANAAAVKWIEADLTHADLPERSFDVWHDRAVLHFLTDAGDRERYVAAVSRAVTPGGHVVVAAFAPDGPTRCSGLDIVQYGADDFATLFGAAFALRDAQQNVHVTPSGAEQRFTYAVLQREG